MTDIAKVSSEVIIVQNSASVSILKLNVVPIDRLLYSHLLFYGLSRANPIYKPYKRSPNLISKHANQPRRDIVQPLPILCSHVLSGRQPAGRWERSVPLHLILLYLVDIQFLYGREMSSVAYLGQLGRTLGGTFGPKAYAFPTRHQNEQYPQRLTKCLRINLKRVSCRDQSGNRYSDHYQLS